MLAQMLSAIVLGKPYKREHQCKTSGAMWEAHLSFEQVQFSIVKCPSTTRRVKTGFAEIPYTWCGSARLCDALEKPQSFKV
jgi:hypothetical protein